MSMLSYIIKTDWDRKKTDWREYRAVCESLRAARHAMVLKRDCITQMVRVFDEEHIGRFAKDKCIHRYVRYEEPTINLDSSECPNRMLNAQVWEDKCKKYTVAPCANHACACSADNAEYCGVRNAYVDLLKKKQNFWGGKFANVK